MGTRCVRYRTRRSSISDEEELHTRWARDVFDIGRGGVRYRTRRSCTRDGHEMCSISDEEEFVADWRESRLGRDWFDESLSPHNSVSY